jgi:hypothetical protein
MSSHPSRDRRTVHWGRRAHIEAVDLQEGGRRFIVTPLATSAGVCFSDLSQARAYWRTIEDGGEAESRRIL